MHVYSHPTPPRQLPHGSPDALRDSVVVVATVSDFYLISGDQDPGATLYVGVAKRVAAADGCGEVLESEPISYFNVSIQFLQLCSCTKMAVIGVRACSRFTLSNTTSHRAVSDTPFRFLVT